jgi:hypothetical protein
MMLTFADKIDPVAIYAAIVSTSLLIWQVFVWFRTGPRLRVSASTNMTTHGDALRDDEIYIVANVWNVGTEQTTITHVVMFAYRSWLHRLRNKPSKTIFVNHRVADFPLPYVLKAGKTFTSIVAQNQTVEKMSRESLLFLGIVHSFSKRPLFARVQPIDGLLKEAKGK